MIDSWKSALQGLSNPITLVCLAIGIIFIAAYLLWMYMRRRNKGESNVPAPTSLQSLEAIDNKKASEKMAQSAADPSCSIDPNSKRLEAAAAEDCKKPMYNGVVFTEDGIKFKVIPEKLKSVIYCDPSVPKSGMKYMAVEREPNKFESYDPRESPINKDNTPQRAWRATHVYDLVKAVWAVPLGQWEKLNTVFFYIFCGGLLFLGVVALSKL